MSGSFITPFPAVSGDGFLADFGALGTIAFSFA
jgi:2-keto-4-pentenoate hydratase